MTPTPGRKYSDAEVDAVIKSLEHVNTDGMDGESWDRPLVRAALQHFQRGRVGGDARDAKRYRWLRDNGEKMIGRDRGCGPEWMYGDELDMAIDALRRPANTCPIRASEELNVIVDLKPCPFCGTDGYLCLRKGHDADDGFFILCEFCACRGPEADDMRGCEKEWNNRPIVSG